MRVLSTFKCQHEIYTRIIALELITRLAPGIGASGDLRDHVTHSHPLSRTLRFVRAPE